MTAHKVLNGDLSRVLFLTAMFLVEGIPYALLIGTYLITLKKHYSYSEIGIIQICSLAIPLKIVFSTCIQNLSCKILGVKKSWIIPTTLLISILFITLGYTIHVIHQEKRYYLLTFIFSLIMMCIGVHEIALSSWSISLLKKENISYAASCKIAGNYIGYFVSGCIFYSLNSQEFCNLYIYKIPQSKPMIEDGDFMLCTGIYCVFAAIACYIFFDEKDDQNPDIPAKRSFTQLLAVSCDMFKNKNIMMLFAFVVCSRMFLYTNSILGISYIFGEVKHDKTVYSIATLISFPFDMITVSLSGYYGKTNSLKKYYYCYWINIVVDFIVIHILFEQHSFIVNCSELMFNIIYVICYISFNSLTVFRNCMIQTFFNSNCDRTMTSLQISIFGTVLNFSSHVSKLYGYRFAEQYGIFLPNKICIVLESAFLILYYLKICNIQKSGFYPKE